MIEVASLHYGVIFKKAFSQPHIFTALVNDFFGIELDIDKVETEKSFSPVVGSVDSRFDLFAEDKKNRIIVDIQHKRLSDHYDRFLHYHCSALLEQVTSAYNYTPKRTIYTLVVLTSGDRHKTDISVTDFEPKTLAGKGIGETKHKMIYVCPKYVSDSTPEPYREWLEAIDDSLDEKIDETQYENKTIQDIFALIKKDKTTPQEYARMKDEYANEEYLQDKKAKAREEGRKQGRKEGRKEGREEGKQQSKQETLISLLTLKFPQISNDKIKLIEATKDIQRLDHWLKQVALATEIEDIDF
ncbi:MAG TPA: hypothetical protein ENJ33_08635 [Thiothrix sp.]|nr:hypothetical protein [Thiothrix sp.]